MKKKPVNGWDMNIHLRKEPFLLMPLGGAPKSWSNAFAIEEIPAVVDQWIDPNTFGAPPFSGDRLATLYGCINDAVQQIHDRD